MFPFKRLTERQTSNQKWFISEMSAEGFNMDVIKLPITCSNEDIPLAMDIGNIISATN